MQFCDVFFKLKNTQKYSKYQKSEKIQKRKKRNTDFRRVKVALNDA